MDRQTISRYGQLVCVVLIIAILIGLAAPFASILRANFVGTINGFRNHMDNAIDKLNSNSGNNDLGGNEGSGEDQGGSGSGGSGGEDQGGSGNEGGGSGDSDNYQINEHGFYYNAPYTMIDGDTTMSFVLVEDGTAAIFMGVPSMGITGIPYAVMMSQDVDGTWSYSDEKLIATLVLGSESMPMEFIVSDNGLILTAADDNAMQFICAFEEYHDVYFETTYYNYMDEVSHATFFANGSMILGSQSMPEGSLIYETNKITMGDASLYVSMNGRDIYIIGQNTKMLSLDPAVHTCDYKEKVTSSDYLATEGTCTTKATYYYSCSCGEKGTETFEGSLGDHTYENTYCTVCGEKQPGLYETGSNYTVLLKSWNQLMDEGIINLSGCAAYDKKTELAGDLWVSNSIASVAYAFEDCVNLTGVSIPNNITNIGHMMFDGCTSLTNIIIPDNIISISDSAFSGCANLTNVNIPDSVTNIGRYAFFECKNLTIINIPGSVTSMGENAFFNCTSLTNVKIGDGVTSIGDGVFGGCTSLTSIEIPDSVTIIGNNAFQNCTSLISIEIPDSATSIGAYAFNGCTNLTSIEIPDSVTIIDNGTFNGCTSLISIKISDSVTSIGDSAFRNCKNLTNINIPDGVTSIGDYAFQDCTSLTTINFSGTVEQWNAITKVLGWNQNVPATEVICSNGTVSLT